MEVVVGEGVGFDPFSSPLPSLSPPCLLPTPYSCRVVSPRRAFLRACTYLSLHCLHCESCPPVLLKWSEVRGMARLPTCDGSMQSLHSRAFSKEERVEKQDASGTGMDRRAFRLPPNARKTSNSVEDA